MNEVAEQLLSEADSLVAMGLTLTQKCLAATREHLFRDAEALREQARVLNGDPLVVALHG